MIQPFHIEVDFKQKKQFKEPIITQFDDVEFIVSVLDSGRKVELDGNYKLVTSRPDGKTYYVDGVKSKEPSEINRIIFDLGKSEVEVLGRCMCVVQLFDSNKQRTTSFPFSFTVVEDLSLTEQPSDSERTLLEIVIQDGPGLVEYMKDNLPVVERVINEQGTYQPQIDEIKSEMNTVTEHLAQNELLQKQTALFAKLKGVKKKLPFPVGFTWSDAPINIYKDINGEITTDFDVSTFQHVGAGKTYYVNKDTGHNRNNDGLSESTPLKSIWAAITKPDVDVVIVSGGYYERSNGFAGNKITRSMSIKAKDGEKVTVSISDNLTWTKTEGMNNVYQSSRSSSVMVFDRKFIDEHGDYYKLKKKTSIAEVEAEKGSWYTDGSIVYVHTTDSRTADVDIRVFLDLPHVLMTGDAQTLYLEGINLEGGKESVNTEGLTSPQVSGAFFKNCTFKYTNGSNVVRAWGIGRVFSQNCLSAHGRLDGFNYHVFNGVVPDVIEVDCIGRHNGLDEIGDSNNGSTIHDGGRIIRVNGEYFNNKGPNVIDVNEGTQSWCVGTLAYKSVATKGTVSNSDFKNGNVGASEMWLDSCVSHSSDYSIVTAGNGASSKTHIKNLLLLSNIQTDTGALLEEY